ncbi:MAG: STAS domain-containing protein [Deltaproteobacteria bacterium]|nr:STAS domain-containing protein [Deltaproteobacteria bacterium]
MIKVSNLDNIFTLHISGDIDHLEMVNIRNTIADLIKDGHLNVIVSMNEVEHINYLSIGVLVERLKRLRICGGDLKLVGMSRYIRNIFTVVGADEFFESFESMEDALSSFAGSGECHSGLLRGR